MGNLIVGFLLGITAATIGFTGMARVADNGVHKVQNIIKEVR